ncbi:MAG: methyltransferase, partial [Myxococcota bacterium]
MIRIPKAVRDRKAALEAELGEPVTISGIAGSMGLFQRVHGHRHSIDDAITAWYALTKRPRAKRVLDLGAGIGTVGLALLHGLGPRATMTCIEAQNASFRILRANLRCNDLSERVTAIHGDLRDVDLGRVFDLVT